MSPARRAYPKHYGWGKDNGRSELRALALFGRSTHGRKAWLFSGSPIGATASAGWYSLIETAKINAVEPYLYLRSVLSRLPESEDPEDYRIFLPWNIDKRLLLDFDSEQLS